MASAVITKHKARARGFTLAELAIVIAIIGVILGSIWALSGSMGKNVRQQKFSELLTLIVNNIRGNYAGQASFNSTSASTMMPLLMNMNVFPGDIVHVDTSTGKSIADSPFGEVASPPIPPYNSLYVCGWQATGVSACPTGAGTANVPLFAIEVLFSKSSDCIPAVLRNASPATVPGLIAVYINGNQMATLPPTASTVSSNANCGAAGMSVVDFVYRLNP